MDIQRGDQVYYRGEVWTVHHTRYSRFNPVILYVNRETDRGSFRVALTDASKVQRVEQVR